MHQNRRDQKDPSDGMETRREDSDPTAEVLYLAEEPIREPTPLPRSVYIENAYNMGEALERAGWIVFENEDALSIRLTNEGVRAGS